MAYDSSSRSSNRAAAFRSANMNSALQSCKLSSRTSSSKERRLSLLMRMLIISLLALLPLQLKPCAAVRQTVAAAPVECSSELQTVMCGIIPFGSPAERHACCSLYGKQHATLQNGLQQSSTTATIARPDLALNTSRPDFTAGGCIQFTQVNVPAFTGAQQTTEELNAMVQFVPVLTRDVIKRVKAAATAQLQHVTCSSAGQRSSDSMWTSQGGVNVTSGFRHPGTYVGLLELAHMQQQLCSDSEPHVSALARLISGAEVPKKILDPVSGWGPPTDCSPTDYRGPYPMPVALIRYGGLNDPTAAKCAANYPREAPQQICGHVSFVELDGQMSYKQALSYWATGDIRHAETALRIVQGWAATNKVFGPAMDGNGPLEAAWGCASFSRTMELLRHHPDWQSFGSEQAYQQFVQWVSSKLLPVTDAWVAFKKPPADWGWDGNVYANWHSSIAECWMAFAVLTDDRARYNQSVQLFHTTVSGYLKWGRGKYAPNRLVGESTETLRDIYHTLFGLGGLLQVAEMAWQQDDDLYSSNGHVLAAAMEVHARIVNAGTNESLLPPRFRLFENMPPPPDGCLWRINLGTQLWNAVNKTTGAWVADLTDGHKYVLGSKYLPTAWEIGYNHYAGRLGMSLPESAALLTANPVEYYAFHWGLGTLSHAGSAAVLWRPGVQSPTLCPQSRA